MFADVLDVVLLVSLHELEQSFGRDYLDESCQDMLGHLCTDFYLEHLKHFCLNLVPILLMSEHIVFPEEVKPCLGGGVDVLSVYISLDVL